MLCGSDRGRCGNQVEGLQNNFTEGNYNYHFDMKEAYNIIVNYKTTHSKPETNLVDDSDEV